MYEQLVNLLASQVRDYLKIEKLRAEARIEIAKLDTLSEDEEEKKSKEETDD